MAGTHMRAATLVVAACVGLAGTPALAQADSVKDICWETAVLLETSTSESWQFYEDCVALETAADALREPDSRPDSTIVLTGEGRMRKAGPYTLAGDYYVTV